MKYLTFALVVLISCQSSGEKLEEEARWQLLEYLDKWYLEKSPTYTYTSEKDIRKQGDERNKLLRIVKTINKIPENYDLIDEKNDIELIDNDQAIIKVSYFFQNKANNIKIYSRTYYYDKANTPVPILIKSEEGINSTYSIIEQYD